jgi:hypothetical protein
MSKTNKSVENIKLVQSTKEILKQMGVEMKTTQIYEFYSKLIGYQNWNLAQSKGVVFLDKVIYENYTLEELVLNHKNLSLSLIVKEIHKRMKKEPVTNFDEKTNPFGICQVINWNDKKVAIMTRDSNELLTNEGWNFTEKHLFKLSKAMAVNGCSQGILYTVSHSLPHILYKKAMDHLIEIVDYEDLLRLARQIDSKNN